MNKRNRHYDAANWQTQYFAPIYDEEDRTLAREPEDEAPGPLETVLREESRQAALAELAKLGVTTDDVEYSKGRNLNYNNPELMLVRLKQRKLGPKKSWHKKRPKR